MTGLEITGKLFKPGSQGNLSTFHACSFTLEGVQGGDEGSGLRRKALKQESWQQRRENKALSPSAITDGRFWSLQTCPSAGMATEIKMETRSGLGIGFYSKGQHLGEDFCNSSHTAS